MLSLPIDERSTPMHPLLIGTSVTTEQLMELRAIWIHRHPHEVVQLIGSLEWIEQQRERARREKRIYVAVKSLKRAYQSIEGSTVTQISSKRDTELGKEISVQWINLIELTLALQGLPYFERDCWILSYRTPLSYAEIATTLDTSKESVRTAISSAGKKLIDRVFERVFILSI